MGPTDDRSRTRMKSPHPQDPIRLEVLEASTRIADHWEEIYVTVTFTYQPWEPSRGMDPIREQANALLAVNNLLNQGGLVKD